MTDRRTSRQSDYPPSSLPSILPLQSCSGNAGDFSCYHDNNPTVRSVKCVQDSPPSNRGILAISNDSTPYEEAGNELDSKSCFSDDSRNLGLSPERGARGRGGVIPARNSSRRRNDKPGKEATRPKVSLMAKSPHRFQLALTQSRKNKFRRYG